MNIYDEYLFLFCMKTFFHFMHMQNVKLLYSLQSIAFYNCLINLTLPALYLYY